MKPNHYIHIALTVLCTTLAATAKAETDDMGEELPGMGPQPASYFVARSNAAAEQKAAANPRPAEQAATYFYTGKPYDEDLGAYVFAFRNYDPELNRWTTSDPSGFPDGANNQSYAPNPLLECDPFGLRTSLGKPPVLDPSDWTYGGYDLLAGNLYQQTRARWEYTGWAYNNIEGAGNSGQAATFGTTVSVNASASVQLSGNVKLSGAFGVGVGFTATGGIGVAGAISESKPATPGVSWEAKGLIGTGQINIEYNWFELNDGQYTQVSVIDWTHSSYSYIGGFKAGVGIEWLE